MATKSKKGYLKEKNRTIKTQPQQQLFGFFSDLHYRKQESLQLGAFINKNILLSLCAASGESGCLEVRISFTPEIKSIFDFHEFW
jgi:hypothetical protein